MIISYLVPNINCPHHLVLKKTPVVELYINDYLLLYGRCISIFSTYNGKLKRIEKKVQF